MATGKREGWIDISWIPDAKAAWVALHKQIELVERHIQRLEDQKRGRFRVGSVSDRLVEVEVAYCQELLAVLQSVKTGKETPMS